jgi:hypothetical protein
LAAKRGNENDLNQRMDSGQHDGTRMIQYERPNAIISETGLTVVIDSSLFGMALFSLSAVFRTDT